MTRPAHANPFRTARLVTLAWLGEDPAALAAAFIAGEARFAIEGGEGAGKSTLQRAIGDALRARGEYVVTLTLPASAARPACAAATTAAIVARTAVVLIDGFEQLSRWQRWRIRRRCRRLLVTAHGPVGMPVLTTLRPTTATLDRLIDQLLPAAAPTTRAAARAAFAACDGDVRRTCLTLYDAWADGRIS